MSVNVLYCEGGPKSPDIRVLGALLAGICLIEPMGGKYGLGEKIQFSRVIRTQTVVAGIRDRDFDDDDTIPTMIPRQWRVENGSLWLGWYWERTTIENYLIDPIVVERALAAKAPQPDDYQTALRASAASIADYTAARTALSCSRVRFAPLDNSWGPKHGGDKHRFPDDRHEDDCRVEISTIVNSYAQRIPEADVLNRFDTLLPSCRPGGYRLQHFMTFFSGKDLLFGMQTALVGLGLGSPFAFRERIIKGIESSVEDVCTWLPEWQQLRDKMRTIASNVGP
jgi:hypothetical protein